MQMDGLAVGERGWSESGDEGDDGLCLACESATMTAKFGSREVCVHAITRACSMITCTGGTRTVDRGPDG